MENCDECLVKPSEQLEKASKVLMDATKHLEDTYTKLLILFQKIHNLSLEVDKVITSPNDKSINRSSGPKEIPKNKSTVKLDPELRLKPYEFFILILGLTVLGLVFVVLSRGLQYLMYKKKPIPPLKISARQLRNLHLKACGCPKAKNCNCYEAPIPDIDLLKDFPTASGKETDNISNLMDTLLFSKEPGDSTKNVDNLNTNLVGTSLYFQLGSKEGLSDADLDSVKKE